MSIICYYSAATDIGSRESNQDNFSVCGNIPFSAADINYSAKETTANSHPALFAVGDGVGSHESSAETVHLTLEVLNDEFRKYSEEPDKEAWVCETVRNVQGKVSEFLRETEKNGSNTLAFLVIDKDFFIFANIGDSPAFMLKNGYDTVNELSVRHNLETYHRLTGKPVGSDDSRYLIYSFGSNPFDLSSVVNITEGALDDGDCFIICSDGISNALNDNDIADMLRSGATARDFVEKASRTPGSDNCTAIVIRLTLS